MKILIIDDDDLIRLTCRSVLQKAGFSVVEASNGNAGVAAFKSEAPDLVITDILMPDKEGLETITEIRAHNPQIKIIAMSGGGHTQNMTFLKLAEKMGANCTLNKPVKPNDLLNAIKGLMGI